MTITIDPIDVHRLVPNTFADGELEIIAVNDNVLPPSPYEAIFFGSVPEGPETNLMLDELVIATQPIGCP